ncbi:unnamed protein product [Urochloa humidicola]
MVRPWIHTHGRTGHARRQARMIAAGPRPRHVGGCGGLYAGAVGSGRRRIGAQGCTKGGLGAGHRILLRGRPPVATSTGSPYPPAPPPAGAKVCYPRGRFAANSPP